MKPLSASRLANSVSTFGIRVLSAISCVIALTLIAYSGYALYDAMYTQSTAFTSATDLFEYKPTKTDPTGTEPSIIQAMVEDYTAWITIDDTHIDYPVVQGKNDLYYASHDVLKHSSLTGSIYLASDNKPDYSDNYNILYGHHMDNGAMFGDLELYLKNGFYEEHTTGILIAPAQAYKLTVFAVFETDAYNYDIYTPGNRDLDTVRGYIKALSSKYNEEVANSATKIVVLSTCLDYVTYGRILIAASMEETEIAPPDTPDEPVPGPDKTIKKNDPPLTPLDEFLNLFQPTGSHHKAAWSIVDLLCLLFSVYTIFPLMNLLDKFGRIKKMRQMNEEKMTLAEKESLSKREQKELNKIQEYLSKEENNTMQDAIANVYYNVDKFKHRFTFGLVLEIAVAVGSLVLFIITQDMRLPMTLVDKWTPFFAVLLFTSWIIDRCAIRYRAWLKRHETIIAAYEGLTEEDFEEDAK